MVVIATGVAGYNVREGWRSWRQRERGAAVGSFLLAVASMGLPVALALLGR